MCVTNTLHHFKRVVCGISGGVDSLVAAILLKQAKFDVLGVFMRNWDIADETGLCSIDADKVDAQNICEQLQIPFQEVSFVKEYWNEVFSNFILEYERGWTPNPDILCNQRIKFGAFFNLAMTKYSADAIATGHYARSSYGPFLDNYHPEEKAKLLKPRDSWKDQTFFLSQISQDALKRTIFPLANLTKAEVRQIALDAGFIDIVKKKESMGICFIGSRNFQTFINEYIANKPGDVIDIDSGEVVGTHQGCHLYTLGQSCLGTPDKGCYYLVSKNSISNILLATTNHSHPALFSNALVTSAVNWISGIPDELQRHKCMRAEFQFQHVHKQRACRITLLPSGGVYIELDAYMRAITPGQFAVLYHGEECLGSGQIISYIPASLCHQQHQDWYQKHAIANFNEEDFFKDRQSGI